MTPHDIDTLSRALRSPMLRFAQRLLQPRDQAEDVVQDTLLTLLESADALARARDPRRYVFGVLRHKVADALRRRYRRPEHSAEQVEALDDLLFDAQGAWREGSAPVSWNTPETRLQSDQFFAVVDLCVNHLPEKIGQVFSLRMFLEFEAEEICSVLKVSKTDYWQCLSRARKQLQLCLDQRWFQGDAR